MDKIGVTGSSAEEQAQRILRDARTAEQVDDFFEQSGKGLPKDVLDALENLATEYVRGIAKPATQSTPAAAFNAASDVAAKQALCQVFFHISQIKGAAASPLTQAMQATATLPHKKFNSSSALTSALTKAYDTAFKPKTGSKRDGVLRRRLG